MAFELILRYKCLTQLREDNLHSQIKFLDLSHNSISKLPCDLFHLLPNLTKLYLDYNELNYLPAINEVNKTAS